MAAVVKAIITSRNCSISSSSGRSSSCNSSSITLCLLQKNSNSDGGDNSKNTFKDF